MRALALGLVIAAAVSARADFVRGAIKIDVRDAKGKPQTATVSVRGAGGAVPSERVGEVYVASGLVDGEYTVEAESVSKRVRVRGHLGSAVVFVTGAKGATAIALGPEEPACDGDAGQVVEAVAFFRGALGAGRVDIKSARGKLVCSAILAGGSAALRLVPGDYEVSARFVGGGSAREHYSLVKDSPAPPLVLHAR